MYAFIPNLSCFLVLEADITEKVQCGTKIYLLADTVQPHQNALIQNTRISSSLEYKILLTVISSQKLR